jgi:hypothetical protein
MWHSGKGEPLPEETKPKSYEVVTVQTSQLRACTERFFRRYFLSKERNFPHFTEK